MSSNLFFFGPSVPNLRTLSSHRSDDDALVYKTSTDVNMADCANNDKFR